MGLDTAPNASELIGAVNGVTIAGGLIGALLQSEQSDTLGRRKSVALSCAIAVLGGALQTGSVHIAMFIVARLIAGLGVGMTTCSRSITSNFNRRFDWVDPPVPERNFSTEVARPYRWIPRHLHFAGDNDVQVSRSQSSASLDLPQQLDRLWILLRQCRRRSMESSACNSVRADNGTWGWCVLHT
jgi:hypothetical protein